jgi:hypothetical protein
VELKSGVQLDKLTIVLQDTLRQARDESGVLDTLRGRRSQRKFSQRFRHLNAAVTWLFLLTTPAANTIDLGNLVTFSLSPNRLVVATR